MKTSRARHQRPRRKDVNAVRENPSSQDSDNPAINFVVDSVVSGERGEQMHPLQCA